MYDSGNSFLNVAKSSFALGLFWFSSFAKTKAPWPFSICCSSVGLFSKSSAPCLTKFNLIPLLTLNCGLSAALERFSWPGRFLGTKITSAVTAMPFGFNWSVNLREFCSFSEEVLVPYPSSASDISQLYSARPNLPLNSTLSLCSCVLAIFLANSSANCFLLFVSINLRGIPIKLRLSTT